MMSALAEFDALLHRLTLAEKALLLQRIAEDLANSHPGIERVPDVCGGDPVIVRTRIPVWGLERLRQLGSSDIDILRAYPTLRAEDLANAWAFVRSHREEIARQIAENEAD